MKKLIINTGLLLILVIGFLGCYKDVILPDAAFDPDGPPKSVSFKADIEPLVISKCGLSGCHVSGVHKPFMTGNISYLQIVNGGYVNLILPKESILYKRINSDMKEYIPSAVDRQKIYDWIRNGALNN